MKNLNNQRCKDLTPFLANLATQVTTPGYVVSLRAKIFSCPQSIDIVRDGEELIEHLFEQEMLALRTQLEKAGVDMALVGKGAAGMFIEASFDDFLEKTANFFAYVGDDVGVDELVGSVQQREAYLAFWDVVMPFCKILPDRCIEYIPSPSSYLRFSAPWSCSAILLDAKKEEALFVYLNGVI